MALPVLLADKQQIAEIVKMFSPAARQLADAFFPGALTISCLNPLRCRTLSPAAERPLLPHPRSSRAAGIDQRPGEPIVGTSANLSGHPSALTAEEVISQIGDKIDMVVDGGRCPAVSSPPSLIFPAKNPLSGGRAA